MGYRMGMYRYLSSDARCAYINARDCLLMKESLMNSEGIPEERAELMGKSMWNRCGITDEILLDKIWNAAEEDLCKWG